jgi:hypothetical protein
VLRAFALHIAQPCPRAGALQRPSSTNNKKMRDFVTKNLISAPAEACAVLLYS